MNDVKGFIVQIDWSQTEKTHIFVEGATSREEAIAAVRKGCNCPRIYGYEAITSIIKI